MSKGCRRGVKKAYIRIANRWQEGCRKDNKTTLLNPFQSDPSAIHTLSFLDIHPLERILPNVLKGLLISCNQMSADYLFQTDKCYDVTYDTGDKVNLSKVVNYKRKILKEKGKKTRSRPRKK